MVRKTESKKKGKEKVSKRDNHKRFDGKIWKVVETVENKDSRDAITEYLDFLRASKDAKHNTILSNVRILRKLANDLDVSLPDATDKDLQKFFSNNTNLAPTSRNTYKQITKGFYKHHLGKDKEYPENVEWIKVKRVSVDRTAGDMLTPEDMRKLVDACTNPRDKALVMVLYESGFRLSEFLALRIGDIDFKEGYADIDLPTEATSLKTGRRGITLVNSVPYLQVWIENHPNRDDLNSPLWPPIYGENDNKSIHNSSLSRILRRIGKRAGIPNKKLRPHLFRHSCATQWAIDSRSEAEMRMHFGWTKRSDMPAHYIHLAGYHVKEKTLELHGLTEKKEKEKSPIAQKQCFSCNQYSGVDSVFCQNCGRPLSAGDLKELRDKEDRHEKLRVMLLEKLNELEPEALVKALASLLGQANSS